MWSLMSDRSSFMMASSALLRQMMILFWLLASWLVMIAPAWAEKDRTEFLQTLASGVEYRQQGRLNLSREILTALRQQASSPEDQVLAAGELGATLLQMRQLTLAGEMLGGAYAQSDGRERARYAIDLAHLAVARHNPEEARRYLSEAGTLSAGDSALQALVALNEASLAPEEHVLERLAGVATLIPSIREADTRAALSINLGHQARKQVQKQKPAALPLAWQALVSARRDAPRSSRLQVEALDALAQLYEDQQRDAEALTLTEQALAVASGMSHPHMAAGTSIVGDLLIQLYWRQGRLQLRLGQRDAALLAYQAAVESIERIRQDIPIEYEGNRSSFRDTLEPIYLGLAELLLEASERLQGAEHNEALKKVRSVVELIKQSEMQDYLGERCILDAESDVSGQTLPAGTAVLYPVILPGRLELVLETATGMERRTSRVTADGLRATSLEFTRRLRSEPTAELPQSRQIYDWLIRPLDEILTRQNIRTLVIVPDGVIRTLPLAALHDGQHYLIERLAVAVSPGLSMIRRTLTREHRSASLIAGLATPGPVVEKLSTARIAGILQQPEESGRMPENVSTVNVAVAATAPSHKIVTRAISVDSLKRQAADALSLPGVRLEVEALGRQLHATPLLDSAFTLSNFSNSVGSGKYGVVHIASHGIFGGSGDESFILAYDEILTMNRLQTLLQSEGLRKQPIRLLTLSACETAEGNERAPLGIAGAAIKARAESALGTLWPVEDSAATKIMNTFYDQLVGQQQGRAESLRQAQISLLRQVGYEHPFFWAPFIIIGNWD